MEELVLIPLPNMWRCVESCTCIDEHRLSALRVWDCGTASIQGRICSEHVHDAQAKANLADVIRRQGRLGDAEQMLKNLVDQCHVSFGRDDAHTLKAPLKGPKHRRISHFELHVPTNNSSLDYLEPQSLLALVESSGRVEFQRWRKHGLRFVCCAFGTCFYTCTAYACACVFVSPCLLVVFCVLVPLSLGSFMTPDFRGSMRKESSVI